MSSLFDTELHLEEMHTSKWFLNSTLKIIFASLGGIQNNTGNPHEHSEDYLPKRSE